MSLTTSMKKAVRKVEKAVTGTEPQTDLLDTLKEEHEEVGAMLKKLIESTSSKERRSLVGQIKAALVPHSKAEQKVLYDAIIACKDRRAQTDGTEGYIEHALVSKTLTDLEKITDTASVEFAATAKVLRELVEHHVQEEESAVWTDARRHFDTQTRQAMNRRYLNEKRKLKAN